MTKTLLFLTLMLVAPVVGAEEILFNNCMKLHANTVNEPLCDRFRYQPAEEAKDYCRACKEELTFSSYCQDVGCYDKEPKKQPAEEAKQLKYDPSRPILEIEQSDAEKWRLLCQDYSNSCESTGYSCDRAQVYCTRAILEEMRNN